MSKTKERIFPLSMGSTPLGKGIEMIFDPIVHDLLNKTYVSRELESSADELGSKLDQIITTSSSIKKILSVAASNSGIIRIINFNGGIKNGMFEPSTNTIYVRDIIGVNGIARSLDDIVSTYVHEATHKAIKIQYPNNIGGLPYDLHQEASFVPIQKAIYEEIERLGKLYSKSFIDRMEQLQADLTQEQMNALPSNWLTHMVLHYTEEGQAAEILPHLIQALTLNILNQKEFGVSQEFIDVTWRYLQDVLIDVEKHDEDVILQRESAPIVVSAVFHEPPEPQSEIAIEAKILINQGSISLNWLNSEAGKLAFKVSLPVIKLNFLNSLFLSKSLEPDLIEHVVHLLEVSNNKSFFIEKLFTLKDKNLAILKSVIEQKTPELMQACGEARECFLKNLAELGYSAEKPEELVRQEEFDGEDTPIPRHLELVDYAGLGDTPIPSDYYVAMAGAVVVDEVLD